MLRDKIINLGGAFNYIGKKVLYLYKMVSKKIIESITLILTNSTGDDLIDYKIYGNSKQATTTGKNLMGLVDGTYSNNGVTIVASNGKLTINGKATATSFVTVPFIKTVSFSDQTYTTSLNNANTINDSTIRLYTTGTYYENISLSTQNNSLTLSSNREYGSLQLRSSQEVQYNNLVIYPQLEIGSSATSYEPYTNGPSPNPDYPQEIKSVGDLVESGEHQGKYKIPVICSGKNLFDKYNFEYVDKRRLDDNGNEGSDNNSSYSTTLIQVQPSTTYSIQGTKAEAGKTVRIYYYNQNQEFISRSGSYNVDTFYFTTLNNCYYIALQLRDSSNIDLDKIQIEYGAASEYEPYYEPITTNIYIDEPLRKIGDVKDYIDFKTGKRINKIGKIILNGSENWTYSSANHVLYTDISDYLKTNSVTSMCNYYQSVSNVDGAESAYNKGNNKQTLYNGSVAAVYRLYIRDDNFLNSDDYKEWLSDHNVIVCLQLSNSIDESIDLPSIPTFKGTTIITFGSEVDPSNAWVQYYAEEEE